VVPPQQVKRTVDEQHRDLREHVVTRAHGLPTRGFDADDDVPEETVPHVAELPFAHREREHVGRSVLRAIVAVQRVDVRVIREDDGELCILQRERPEDDARATEHLLAIDPFVRAFFHAEPDGHAFARHYLGARVTTTLRPLPMNACVIVPAFQASRSLRAVLEDLRRELELPLTALLVVDDGSTDDTAAVARQAGAEIVISPRNEGKGKALLRGLAEARRRGFRVALTVDADGQHPARSAKELLLVSDDPRALVLGVRNLARDGAPRKNQISNGISNFFLSRFSGRPLKDTQCGLRRYPVEETLQLHARASGYAFEAEVILRALAAGIPVVEHEVAVYYPPESERVTHFDSVRDPMRIIVTVVQTLYDLRRARGAS